MADNVSGVKYVVFRDLNSGENKTIKGENQLLKNGGKANISMFSRGTAQDGRKWIADEGFILVHEKDGTLNKVKNLEFDKDGDGIADEYYKIASLQDGKIKAHKSKHSSQNIDKELSQIMSVSDPQKKAEKLEKLRNKLLNAGIPAEIIDKKFNLPPSAMAIPAQTQKEFTFNTPKFEEMQISKDDISKMKELSPKDTDKYEYYMSMANLEKQNQMRARKCLIDPNLKKYFEQNPQILEQLVRMA